MGYKQPKKHKSVTQKLSRIRTYQTQQVLLSGWTEDWKNDQESTVRKLRKAYEQGDFQRVEHMIRRLEAINEKKFQALNNVLRIVSDPDRQLTDLRQEEIKKSGSLSDHKPDITQNDHNEKSTSSIIKTQEEEQQAIILEITKSYNAGFSLKVISDLTGYSPDKVRKVLITANVYTSERYDDIKFMRKHGMPNIQIAEKLGVKLASVQAYAPYTRGMYNLEHPTESALALREYRKKNKAELTN